MTLTNWRMLQIFFKFFSNLDFVTFWLVLKFFRSEQKRQVVKHHYITFHWLDSSDQKFNIIRIKSLIQNGFDGLFNALLSKSYHFSKATLFCDHHDHHRYIGSSSFLSIQRGFLFCWFWIKFVAGGFALVDKSKKCNNKVFEKPFTTVFLLWREEDASTWKCPPNRLKNHFNCDDELKRERLKIRRCQSR